MPDVKEAICEIQQAFAAPEYPEAFLQKYDQMECLSCRNGVETFLVRQKSDASLHVAKCYDRALYASLGGVNTLRGLSHPGLPVFSDVFEAGTLICTVREYIAGTPLSEAAASGALSREDITNICVKLADVLIYLHALTPPVIHRDIKPQNVILRDDGTPVLIDFDIARTVKGDADSDTRFFGTKGYAAPEQYGFAQTDERADIYSFGVLLRYLLTDSTRENPNVRLYKPLSKIIARCTAFAPKERFSDMRAVKKALLAANPKAQALKAVRIVLISALACALLAFGGVKLYEYVTFSPFTDGHIPSVMQDEERVFDAVSYLQNKYGTHLFDDTDAYMTVGRFKDVLIEMYGMDPTYVRKLPDGEFPNEDPAWFIPWGLGDEQNFDKEHMAYFATKVYWPEVVADWSSVKEDTGFYPGITVALAWCEKYGILTGVKRPYDITRGEAAIALSNADRVYEALRERQG